MEDKIYIAIDLKSFYASVECMERGLDPLHTNLVVADPTRTEKTICLAVSPSLKAYHISGRARLFEVIEQVKAINDQRKNKLPGKIFRGSSTDASVLEACPDLEVDYLVAPPRMSHYMKCSVDIYHIYLRYVSPEDIQVYSIDEVFIDATKYLKTYGLSARDFTMKLVSEVFRETGITATAGIGSNLFLCKVAMDVVAKKIPPDRNGVRIAELTERSYRELIWSHKPITDIWRVGPGYAKKLAEHGMYTMGDVARCSVGKKGEYYCEELLYRLFGINAELLIDHAWGWEPCTIRDIKSYQPTENSICSGQVLQEPYSFDKARLVAKEMADALALDLTAKYLTADQIVLTVNYDAESLNPDRKISYNGQIVRNYYGKAVPQSVHGSRNLNRQTNSSKEIQRAVCEIFDRQVNQQMLVRRITITANHVVSELRTIDTEQICLFDDEAEKQVNLRERDLQRAMVSIKHK